MDAAIVFLCGLLVGVVIGMAVQWLSDLPKEYRR